MIQENSINNQSNHMNHKNHGSDNVPQIRFPEFKDAWEHKFGSEVFKPISDKNHNSDLPILAISQEFGAVPRELINYQISVTDKSIESYKVIEVGDFIISLRSFQGGIEYSNYKGICSPAYIILRPFIEVDRMFFKYYFKTYKYIQHLNSKLEGIRDGKMISYKYFSEIAMPFPTLPEQTRIASFFTVLDNKIAQLKQKKNLLEQYKKGVMQKLFSQETEDRGSRTPLKNNKISEQLRFKDENGKEFPKWEKKPLGNIGETYNGLSGKTKEDFGEGKPYIQYKQIFDNAKIDVTKFDFVEIHSNENQNKAKYGDVFFTTSSETPLEIGFSSVLLDEIEELYLNSFCFGYRINSFKELSPLFAQYLFRSPNFRKDVIKLGQGSTRYNMSKVELMKIEILLPCEKEQLKISSFLATIDNKIYSTENQIQQTQEYKKGLLQNMFC